ncbi:MAG: NADH-quinone oxidoreductase subunit A [Thermoprotei archaeon]|jgi:NADH-quinone oxidoreductase subunit A
MPSWADSVVGAGIILTIGLVAPIIVLLIGKALAGAEHPMKRKRFESGNPPVGNSRGFFSMQYYPYLLMFIIAEPFAIFLFLASAAATNLAWISVLLCGVLILALAVHGARSLAEGDRSG